MRSSPQLTFAVATCRMSFCKSSGMGGLPFDRDFHRQNKRKPFRSQRMSVSGFTTTSALPDEQPAQGRQRIVLHRYGPDYSGE